MSPNRPHRAQCCYGCKTVTLRNDMTAWESEGEPSRFDGKLICETCKCALVAEEHERRSEHCICTDCRKAHAEHLRVLHAREAATYGGLDQQRLALLGLTCLLTDLGLATDESGD